jgi:hypothetical protein
VQGPEVGAEVGQSDLLLLVHGITWASERAAQPPDCAERLLGLALDGLRPTP